MSVYSDAVLVLSPRAFYSLADTNATAIDASGNALNGAFSGTYTQNTAGLVPNDGAGKCVDFNGSSGYVFVDANVAANVAPGITIAGWIKADAIGAANTIANLASFSNGNPGVRFSVITGGSLRVSARSWHLETERVSTYAAGLGTTLAYHVACVVDFTNDRIKIYVNGAEVLSEAQPFTYGTMSPDSGWGGLWLARQIYGDYFNGKIDDLALFRSALSAGNIAALYAAGTTMNLTPATVAVPVAGQTPGFSPFQVTIPLAAVALSWNDPQAGLFVWPPAGALDVNNFDPAHISQITVSNTPALEVASYEANYLWTPPQQRRWTIIYRCTLTGSADGLDDLVLPIESYQARLRSGSPSFVSVVVPDGPALAAGIAARANGELVIERGVRFADGSMQLTELTRVDLESISSARGGRNWSVTLSGHATTTTSVPKTLTLQGVSYLATGSGSRRVRAAMDLNLRPGDTAVAEGTAIVVGLISHTVSTAGETMEITEAVA